TPGGSGRRGTVAKKAWLFVGVGIKRWLAVAVLGILLMGLGLAVILNTRFIGLLEDRLLTLLRPEGAWTPALGFATGGGIAAFGALLSVAGLRQAARALVAAVWSGSGEALAHRIYDRHQLQRGPRVVAIGGGTGLSTLLRGLKRYTSNITAIVTVADDGGSSGRLTEARHQPPGGDRQRCRGRGKLGTAAGGAGHSPSR